jgi:hypothetical protein
MRYLFTTLQFIETDFYGRVSRELERMGHECVHAVFSRQGAEHLRSQGFTAWCLPDLLEDAGRDLDVPAEVARIESAYDIPSIRRVHLTDPPVRHRPEAELTERSVRHFRALERVFDEAKPEVLVPEVGRETMRQVATLIAEARGITYFYFYLTIFPNSLLLFANRPYGPIIDPNELRELTPEERDEVEAFIEAYKERAKPIYVHRKSRVRPDKLRDFARHIRVSRTVDRDNEYLRPSQFVKNYARLNGRRVLLSRLYDDVPADRPFVYFPVHVIDDFKIELLIPHCADQEFLIKLVADSLPQGYDVVLKEHPLSLGRNPVSMLRRLSRMENVRLVHPETSSHELIRRAEAVTVISSTVGLEALMYDKPVMTMGRPFWSGYGVTFDLESFREVREAVPRLLEWKPDPERIRRFFGGAMRSTYPGKPGLQDPSDENVKRMAGTLDAAARRYAADAVAVRV